MRRVVSLVGARRTRTALTPILFFLQFLQLLGSLIGTQLALQFFEGEGNYVVMVGPGEPGVGGDVEPKFVHEFDILRSQARVVRADGILADAAVWRTDL